MENGHGPFLLQLTAINEITHDFNDLLESDSEIDIHSVALFCNGTGQLLVLPVVEDVVDKALFVRSPDGICINIPTR
jgi:hypothetical protein